MANPVTILVEILINGTWTDMSSLVYERDTITITQGSADETSESQPCQLNLTVNNRDGRFSPQNPNGAWYGFIQRNTQIRVTADTSKRFWGEISELPRKWDTSGNDAYVPLQANGVMRRLQAGTAPIKSPARSFLAAQGPAAYWPLDDTAGATTGINIGSSGSQPFIPNTQPGSTVTYDFGTADMGTFLPKGLQVSDSATAQLTAYAYPLTGSGHTTVAFDFTFKADHLGTPVWWTYDYGNNAWGIALRGDGTNNDIQAVLSQNVSSPGVAPTVTPLGDTGPLTAITDGALHHVRLSLVKSSTSTVWTVYLDGVSVLSGTQASVNPNGIYLVTLAYFMSGSVTPLGLENVAVWVDTIPSISSCYQACVLAFAGEAAGTRMSRVLGENGVTLFFGGSLTATQLMGPQPTTDLMTVVRECATTDGGILAEYRAGLGLLYVPLNDLYNLTPNATISYSSNQLYPSFEPVDDDQFTRNDITVSSSTGGSYEATLETGPLSILAPPNGVGAYGDSVTVNVLGDSQLQDVAGWLLHLGTYNDSRYPTISIHRQRKEISSNPTLSTAVLSLNVGLILTVTGATAAFILDDIVQLIRGYQETITPFEHIINFNCSPGRPYSVGTYDSAAVGNRYMSDGSHLNATMTTTATTVSVATPTGPVWSHSDGNFDIIVAGERMTVTAISGTSTPQTFTVTRSVNGVVKTHASGEDIQLFYPAYYALG